MDSDVLIVKDCLTGNSEAFGMLVEKYEKKLFNTALRIVGDYEDAADATQSAFVKAYANLAGYKSDHRFFSWIYRTLVNESINIVNKRKRLEGLDETTVSTTRNPEESYAGVETARHLQSALMEMKPEHRAVIVLKHFQGMSYQEIGEIVGVSEKTVKSRLFEARRELRKILVRMGLNT